MIDVLIILYLALFSSVMFILTSGSIREKGLVVDTKCISWSDILSTEADTETLTIRYSRKGKNKRVKLDNFNKNVEKVMHYLSIHSSN